MRYLLSVTETYRVPTVEDAKQLHDEMLHDPNFELTAYSYKQKQIKTKGQVVEEYQVVTAKKMFNEEKDPVSSVTVSYEV